MMVQDVAKGGKLRRLDAETLRARVRLPPEYDADGGTHALLDRLIRSGLLSEAARLLSYALPPREAVWWACMCVSHTARNMSGAERQALDAAETWVRRPDDVSRRGAAWAAQAAGYAAPGAWPALAAYWARPSVAGDTRGGRGVETAVTRAAERDGPRWAAARLRRFFASAHEIAYGGMGKLPPETSRTGEASE